jgi:hypothetical protein
LRWAIEDGDRKQFKNQLSVYTEALKNARDRNRSAVRHHLEGRQRAIRRVPNLRTIGQHLP